MFSAPSLWETSPGRLGVSQRPCCEGDWIVGSRYSKPLGARGERNPEPPSLRVSPLVGDASRRTRHHRRLRPPPSDAFAAGGFPTSGRHARRGLVAQQGEVGLTISDRIAALTVLSDAPKRSRSASRRAAEGSRAAEGRGLAAARRHDVAGGRSSKSPRLPKYGVHPGACRGGGLHASNR